MYQLTYGLVLLSVALKWKWLKIEEKRSSARYIYMLWRQVKKFSGLAAPRLQLEGKTVTKERRYFFLIYSFLPFPLLEVVFLEFPP